MKRPFLFSFYLSFAFVVSGQVPAEPNAISPDTTNRSDTECTYSYAKIVPKADALYDEGKFEEALDLYNRALSLRKNDEHVLQRIRQIESRSIEKEIVYNKIVKKADEYYDKREYEKALELYKRAHLFRENDKYVIKRIRETKRKIRQSNRLRKWSSTIQNEN
ncbi:MAG: tetratricopeptide repeat protein [Fluviicola sp.]|nr:tetratricopeptide repeat protein [Fluviicola sp.]